MWIIIDYSHTCHVHKAKQTRDFARLEKLAMILKLILSVAFPRIFKAVAGGIIDLSFFCSRVAAKIKAAQFLAGFLMSDFAEQLWCSGSA